MAHLDFPEPGYSAAADSGKWVRVALNRLILVGPAVCGLR